MTAALDKAHEALLAAALAYADSAGGKSADVDGVSARIWYGAQLRIAADAYGRERRIANRASTASQSTDT